MGSRFELLAFHYPYHRVYDANYQTNSLLKAIWKLLVWNITYFGVELRVRNHQRIK